MNRLIFSAWLGLALSISGGWCAARTLEPQDYFKLEAVASPQISPDGKKIVYVRSRVNVQDDRRDTELWVVNADGSDNRRLMTGGRGVRWSPDGSRIAYVDATDKGNQIFVRWMGAEGNVVQVTRDVLNPYYLNWSPDGKRLSFMATVPAAQKWDITLPGKPAGARWTENAIVIDKLHYRADGIGRVPNGYSHIFVVSADGGVARQLTSGEWNAEPRGIIAATSTYAGPPEWTPDGRELVFAADRALDADIKPARADLHAVNVADGNIRAVTKTDGFWGMLPGPRVSPDGKRIAYIGAQESNASNYPNTELRVVGLNGAEEKVLVADLPGYTKFVQWAGDGTGVYYVSEKEGAQNVHFVTLSGASRDVTEGAQSVLLSSISKNNIAVGTIASAYKTPDLVRLDLARGRQLQRLTAFNDDFLGQIQLGRLEEIWYDSSGNTRVQGWVVYPPDFDPKKQYPLIVQIHGGPEGMSSGDFDFYMQSLAAQGYVVLYTNPRGSTGYGGDFARGVYNAFPGKPAYDDVMKGVDEVVDRGFIDKQRLYVEGCSAGGTLVAWAITQTDRFAAATVMCPIVNMIGFAGSTDVPRWAFNRFEKPFWEDPQAWLDASSIMQVKNIRTPTLILVGENDVRTPVEQSQELFAALKQLQVPTRLVLLRDEWHGILVKPSNILRQQLYVLKWYSEWQKPAGERRPVRDTQMTE